jgi:hypothetical protein
MSRLTQFGSGADSRRDTDAELLAVIALLALAGVIGLATVADYGIGVDEFNADEYGPKSLAWYASGFQDRSSFDSVEETLWFYGPWFHIVTALLQSVGFAEHWITRHALTFLLGLAAVAALLPMARRTVGRWAGLVAIGLCLTTGYFYGSIFFTAIDVPFTFAMTWGTLAIIVMAGRIVPSWPATVATGLLTGLAMATRSSGLITHAYLIGAMTLCGVEAIVGTGGGAASGLLLRIGGRTMSAMLIAWLTAIALWPWLQIGNPFAQFKQAFVYFANYPTSWEFPHWGANVRTDDLPWSYVPAQLAARLPEGFLLLLAVGLLSGIATAFFIMRAGYGGLLGRPLNGLKAAALVVARSRQALIVWAAATVPIAVIIFQHSTLYDGIRHTLFLIPMLALIAGFGFLRLLPLLRRFPVVAAAVGGAYVGYASVTFALLHPLEYVAFNVLAGGVQGAYGRFDLDYWSLAAQPALRRLESRLDREAPGTFAQNPPSIMICIGYREGLVSPMFRRPWRLAVQPAKADFIIETERWRCAENLPVFLIDEFKRFDRTFAWVYSRQPGQIGTLAAPAPPLRTGSHGSAQLASTIDCR